VNLRIQLFGPLSLAGDDAGLTPRLRLRAQRLLVFLLLHRQAALDRETVAFRLWPDQPETEALSSLRRALSDLRAALATFPGQEWVLVQPNELRWNHDADYWLDVDRFERLTQQVTPAALHEAVALYTGDLLSSMDDEWLTADRDRLREMQLASLRRLIAHHRSISQYATALDFARQAIALDPLAETIHRELIALPFLAGDRGAALAEYERLRRVLRDELGVEPMFETRALANAIARGEPLPAAEVVALPPAAFATVPARASPKLIGREIELAKLSTLWDGAAAGHGRLAVVSGEAGVGKSYLALGLSDQVTRGGGLALVGRCYEFEATLPYQAIVDWLRAVANSVRQADLPPVYRSALIRLAPDVMGTAGLPSEAAPSDSREQLFEALLQAFLLVGRSQPLLLLIEDAHWAAESTLDWLAYIAPRLSAGRVLVLITYRTQEVDSQHALARLERRFAREGTVSSLPLAPLSREANRELVAHLSGLEEARAGPVADRLFAETGGNPFFVHEVVRGLIESGQLKIIQGRWSGALIEAAGAAAVPLPATLRATIIARVERLTEMARMFLRTAAVAGRVFDYEVVRRAGDWADEAALSALDNLVARGFTREDERPGAFAFTHHLVQEAIYSDMTAPRRAYLHRGLAEAMQAVCPDDFGALAYHWSLAGNATQEGRYVILAGEQAAACYANDEAIRYLERALVLGSEGSQRTKIMLRLGEVWQLTGDWPKAEAAYRQALALAQSLEDRGAQAKCQAALGRLTRLQGQYAEARLWLEQAQVAYELVGDEKGISEVMGGLGAVYWCQLDFARALEYFEQQLRLARAMNDKRMIGLALGSMGVVYTDQHNHPRALDCYEQRLQIDLEFGDPLSLAKTIGNIGTVYHNQGDYDRALACYAQLLETTLKLGDRQGVAVAAGNMIGIYATLGRYVTAERAARLALALLRVLDNPMYLCEFIYDTAELHLRQARFAEAQALNDEALRIATRIQRSDVGFSAQVLSIRLAVQLDQLEARSATDSLEKLRAERVDEREIAVADDAIWQIDPGRKVERQSAAESYRRLYAETGDAKCRQRYEALTGQRLPEPPALPELPDWVRQGQVNIEALLAQAEQLLAAAWDAGGTGRL
jgi:DNA-binding SARP family transcriptional activator